MVAHGLNSDPEIMKSFPVFDGSYYGVWHLTMKNKLIDLKVWDVIQHGEQETKDKTVKEYYDEMLRYTPFDGTVPTAQEQQDHLKEQRSYYKTAAGQRELTKARKTIEEKVSGQESMAISIIKQSIKESIGGCLVDQISSKACWDKLATQFDCKTTKAKLDLDQRFQSAKIGEMKIVEFVTFLQVLVKEKQWMGVAATDLDVVTRLLSGTCGLDPRYLATIDTLIAMDALDLSKVTSALKAKEETITNPIIVKQVKVPAMQVETSNGSRLCYLCKKEGHRASNHLRLPDGTRDPIKLFNPRTHVPDHSAFEKNIEQLVKKFLTNKGVSEYFVEPTSIITLELDTGANRSMVPSETSLTSLSFLKTPQKIQLADKGSSMYATAVGAIDGTCITTDQREVPILIENVMLVPTLATPLLASIDLTRTDHTIHLKNGSSTVETPNGDVINLRSNEDAVLFDIHIKQPVAKSAKCSVPAVLWHQRMGHLGKGNLQRLTGKVDGFDCDWDSYYGSTCQGCIMGSMPKQAASLSKSERYKPGEKLYLDLMGPFRSTTILGNRYILSILDDGSDFSAVFELGRKSDAAKSIMEFIALAERTTGRKVKIVRSDRAKELTMGELGSYYSEKGIHNEQTEGYDSRQNGRVERLHRTIMDKGLSMLYHANLSMSLFGEAFTTANYLRNLSPTKNQTMTPYEVWYGRKPSVAHLKVFGSVAWAHVPHKLRDGKLAPKARQGVMIGYSKTSKAYRIWHEDGVVTETRHAVFDEKIPVNDITRLLTETDVLEKPHAVSHPSARTRVNFMSPNPFFVLETDDPISAESMFNDPNYVPNLEEDSESDGTTSEDSEVSEPADNPLIPHPTFFDTSVIGEANPFIQELNIPISSSHGQGSTETLLVTETPRPVVPVHDHESTGTRFTPDTPLKPPHDRFYYEPVESRASVVHDILKGPAHPTRRPIAKLGRVPVLRAPPAHDWEAMQSDEKDLWMAAKQKEYNKLMERDTWELGDLPPGRKAIGNQWVHAYKYDDFGDVNDYKSRLVGKGNNQIEGDDFDPDTLFAPSSKMTSMRIVLTIAATRDMEVHSLDAVAAYLNGILDETIYMKQPREFAIPGDLRVCILKKGLYGLRQSGRIWYETLRDHLKANGFIQLKSDDCIYTKGTAENNDLIMLTVSTDDILVACDNVGDLLAVKEMLCNRFEMKDRGEIRQHLAMHISRDRISRTISIHQSPYIRSVIEKFGMSNCTPCNTPLIVNAGRLLYREKKALSDSERNHMQSVPYQEAVGSLIYISITTRPDIAAAVGIVGQFVSNPGLVHWKAVKRIFRYLQGTVDLSLVLGGHHGGPVNIRGLCDSDWASDVDDRKSRTGYLFYIQGSLISWKSSKQQSVATSSTEAEYMAAYHATCEAIWLRRILGELGFSQSNATNIEEDNSSCIAITKNPVYSNRLKHVDIKYHFTRNCVSNGDVKFIYCPTAYMTADCLTKGLPERVFRKFRDDMNITTYQLSDSIGVTRPIMDMQHRGDA